MDHNSTIANGTLRHCDASVVANGTCNGVEHRPTASQPIMIPSKRYDSAGSSFMDEVVSSSPGAIKIKCRRVEHISPVGTQPLPGSSPRGTVMNGGEDSLRNTPTSHAGFRVCSTKREHTITSEVYTLVYVSCTSMLCGGYCVLYRVFDVLMFCVLIVVRYRID